MLVQGPPRFDCRIPCLNRHAPKVIVDHNTSRLGFSIPIPESFQQRLGFRDARLARRHTNQTWKLTGATSCNHPKNESYRLMHGEFGGYRTSGSLSSSAVPSKEARLRPPARPRLLVTQAQVSAKDPEQQLVLPYTTSTGPLSRTLEREGGISSCKDSSTWLATQLKQPIWHRVIHESRLCTPSAVRPHELKAHPRNMSANTSLDVGSSCQCCLHMFAAPSSPSAKPALLTSLLFGLLPSTLYGISGSLQDH